MQIIFYGLFLLVSKNKESNQREIKTFFLICSERDQAVSFQSFHVISPEPTKIVQFNSLQDEPKSLSLGIYLKFAYFIIGGNF